MRGDRSSALACRTPRPAQYPHRFKDPTLRQRRRRNLMPRPPTTASPPRAITTVWNGTMPPPVTGKVAMAAWNAAIDSSVTVQVSVAILPSWMVITSVASSVTPRALHVVTRIPALEGDRVTLDLEVAEFPGCVFAPPRVSKEARSSSLPEKLPKAPRLRTASSAYRRQGSFDVASVQCLIDRSG